MANTNTFNQAGWTFDEVLYTFNGDLFTPVVPVQAGGDVLYFSAAGQEYDAPVIVTAVVWASDQATDKDIAAGDDMLLTDPEGNRIVGKVAAKAGDGLTQSIWSGHRCPGIRVDDLDGGVLYVFIKRL